MPVVIHPSDGTVLADDAVYDIIDVPSVGGQGYLFVYGILDLLIILGMHHALEVIACQFTEFIHGLTSVDIACGLVDIQELHGLVRPVDKKSSRHLLCQPFGCRHPFFGRNGRHYFIAYQSVSLHLFTSRCVALLFFLV